MDIQQEFTKAVRHPTAAGLGLAVLRRCFFSPITFLPAFMATGSFSISWLFNGVAFFQNAGMMMGGLAVVAYGYNFFFRRRKHFDAAVAKFYLKEEKRQNKIVNSMCAYLYRLCRENTARGLARKGGEHIKLVLKQYRMLTESLRVHLSPTELSYGRILGSSREALSGVIQNIAKMSLMLKSLETIYAHKAIGASSSGHGAGSHDSRSQAAIDERKDIAQEQLDRIGELISANEEALTAFAKTTSELAALTAGGGVSTQSFETVVDDLKLLAERVKKFEDA